MNIVGKTYELSAGIRISLKDLTGIDIPFTFFRIVDENTFGSGELYLGDENVTDTSFGLKASLFTNRTIELKIDAVDSEEFANQIYFVTSPGATSSKVIHIFLY